MQNVLLSYASGAVCEDVPFWSMATTSVDSLRSRAEAIVLRLTSSVEATVVMSEALPGAGSAPGVSIPSIALSVKGDHVQNMRRHSTPVIARVEDNCTVIDLRSCLPADDDVLVSALSNLFT